MNSIKLFVPNRKASAYDLASDLVGALLFTELFSPEAAFRPVQNVLSLFDFPS